MTGREAAAYLEVKRETLYAYVSRGLLRGVPAERGRERLYLREDIERLKARHDARSGHGPVAASALRWGEPVLETAISSIRADGHTYRGRSALELAKTCSFEEVAELLWGSPGNADIWCLINPEISVSLYKLASLVPRGAGPLTALSIAVPALAATDPTRFDMVSVSTDPRSYAFVVEVSRARNLIRDMAVLAGLSRGKEEVARALEGRCVAEKLLLSLGGRPSKKAVDAMDTALVLMADHELNASSFAVRIAASAGADLYACASAGLATLSGPKHGGECNRIEALVAEAGRPERAARVIHERAQRGDTIPGFGHPLYPNGDPRTTLLLEAAVAIAPRSVALRTLLALVTAMREAGHEPPTVDAGLVGLSFALGLPQGSAAAIFAIGRAAGWIAHALEQRAAGFLLRPRARYVGP